MIHAVSTHQLNDEIDLTALGAALVRRWHWIVVFSCTGLLLSLLTVFQKRSQVDLQMIVDVSQGPQQPQMVVPVSPKSASPNLIPVYQPRYSTQSAILLLNQALIAASGDGAQRSQVIIGLPKAAELRSGTLVSLSVQVPLNQVSRYRHLFVRIKRILLAFASQGLMQGDLPARQDFVRIHSQEVKASSFTNSYLIGGGLSGLIVGVCAALLVDRLANRVFTVSEILLRVGYPLRAKFPHLPWEVNSIQAELEILSEGLDENMSWYVLSIAESHSLVRPLVTALRLARAELQVEEAAPLLSQPLRIPHEGLPLGFLIVVEPGFNSPQALSEAQRVLNQIRHLEDVGLVLIGRNLLPELKVPPFFAPSASDRPSPGSQLTWPQ